MLITRDMSLGKLKPKDVSNFEIYTMRDNVIDGESAISDDTVLLQKQDIHAKVYMMRNGSSSDLYLGSLNASTNGVYRNIEFMLRLSAKKEYLNIKKLKADLFCGDVNNPNNPFILTNLDTNLDYEDDDKINALNDVIKNINRSNPSANVRKDDDDNYSIYLEFNECDIPNFNVILKNFKITLRPLLSNKTENFGRKITFTDLKSFELSKFYAIVVADNNQESDNNQEIERILIIKTDGLPDDREKSVITKVISDKNHFYKYIYFLLGDASILSSLEPSVFGKDIGGQQNRKTYNIPALYERMLQTAATDPEKFKDIDYLIKTISDDGIIPDDFKMLHKAFKKVVKLNG